MKKKVTNDDVKTIISNVADKVRRELDLDLRIAISQMNLKEDELVKSFSSEQQILFKDYLEARQTYIDLSLELLKIKK